MERRWILAQILFLGAFAFYLHGAYPSVSAGDSGEFIAASHTVGIPHAPGYPTYVLLAKCVQRTIPWGNIGYRTNLFSSICGALAVVFVFGLCLQLALPAELAGCAALIFMLSHAQVVNAQASEVFALHALFCGGVVWAAVANQWVLAAFLFGLGLGNHQTLLLIAPALAFLFFSKPPAERVSWGPLLISLAAGFSVNGFLYLRAAKMPVINGGDPETLGRLWRVLTRADYGSTTLALGETPERNIQSTLLQLARFAHGLCDQVGWPGALAGLTGIVLGFWKRNIPAIALTTAFLLMGPFFFLLGNLPFDAQSTGVLERFYIVPTLYASLLLAIGIGFLTGQRRWLLWAAFALPVFLWSRQASAFPFRGDFRAYAYGRNNLHTLSNRALFIMDGGDDTFYTLAYLTRVENRRPDAELRDRGSVVFPGLYGTDFRSLPHDEKEERRQQVELSLLASGHTFLYSTMNESILPGHALVSRGILYQPSSAATSSSDFWAIYDLRGILPWQSSDPKEIADYRTRALLPFYAYQRGVQAARAGHWEDAMGFASAARSIGPDVVWLIPNLTHNAYQWAQANFQAGRLDLAARFYLRITDWDPHDATAWADLGAVEERRQRLDAAIVDYQTAIRIDPSSEAAHFNLAVAYWKRSDWPNVMQELQRVLAINPANAAARNYLVQIQAKQKTAS